MEKTTSRASLRHPHERKPLQHSILLLNDGVPARPAPRNGRAAPLPVREGGRAPRTKKS